MCYKILVKMLIPCCVLTELKRLANTREQLNCIGSDDELTDMSFKDMFKSED